MVSGCVENTHCQGGRAPITGQVAAAGEGATERLVKFFTADTRSESNIGTLHRARSESLSRISLGKILKSISLSCNKYSDAQAIHERRPVHRGGLVHHSDRGSQYVSIKYTERLAEAGIEPSVGSVGDSYDNALAETINGLYKAEAIHRRGPWRSFEAVEYATLEWVDWFNNRRLLEPIGNIPPAEAEERYYAMPDNVPMAA